MFEGFKKFIARGNMIDMAVGVVLAIVAKQRNGETGNVYFGHNQSITKFYDYVPPMEYLNKYAK